MPIFSVSDITNKPLSKYTKEDIIKDLDELKQNGGITKKQDFEKLMKYFMKKKFKYVYRYESLNDYRNIYEKIYEMYPDLSESQIYFLFKNLLVNKGLLVKLELNKFHFKFEYIHAFLNNLSIYNIKESKEDIYYIISKFVERENIDEKEYQIDYEKYNKLKCNIIFSYCKEINKINFDKKCVKNFIIKLDLSDDFINYITQDLTNTTFNDFEDFGEFVKSINIPTNIVRQHSIHNKIFWLNIFNMIFTEFNESFTDKLNLLSIDKFTSFIIVLFNIFCFSLSTQDYETYEIFLTEYNTKFDDLMNKIKNIRNKISINYNNANIHKILKHFVINDLYLDDINKEHNNLDKTLFEQSYKGEYNTELLNRCIRYSFGQEMIDFLLKEKHINFNSDTMRYSIYKQNLYVIEYLLDNKYLASDKDFLNCNNGTFLKKMCEIYKKYNILISDDIARQLYFKLYKVNINMDYYPNL